MLPLASEKWSSLADAYGPAVNIPRLLRQLESFPPSKPDAEPWYSLWSALCHQGDVYTASFAAVPHIIEALSAAPERAGFDYYLLPAAIEVARVENGVAVPAELREAYEAALRKLPPLAAVVMQPDCDSELCQSALAASAVGAGATDLAKLLIELDRKDISEVLEWYFNR